MVGLRTRLGIKIKTRHDHQAVTILAGHDASTNEKVDYGELGPRDRATVLGLYSRKMVGWGMRKNYAYRP